MPKNPVKIPIAPYAGSSVYTNLVTRIAREMKSGLINAQKTLEYARLKTYWEIGKHIQEAVDASSGTLHPCGDLYQQLASDIFSRTQIDLTVDTIRRIVKFYKNHPVFPENSPLTLQFLITYLSLCPVIIIRSTKAGMYGRWLADIFAIQECDDIYRIAREGMYINQLLLDKGLAEKY